MMVMLSSSHIPSLESITNCSIGLVTLIMTMPQQWLLWWWWQMKLWSLIKTCSPVQLLFDLSLTILSVLTMFVLFVWANHKQPQWLMMTYLRGVLLLLTQRWREERWPGLATRSVLIIMVLVTHLHLIAIFIVLVVFFMDISSGIRRVGCGRLWRGGSEGNRRPLEQDWGIWKILIDVINSDNSHLSYISKCF